MAKRFLSIAALVLLFCNANSQQSGPTQLQQIPYRSPAQNASRYNISRAAIANAKTSNIETLAGCDNAFAYNDNGADFTGIILPSTFTTFGNGVFSDCPNLASIILEATIPPALGSIGGRGGSAVPITLYVPAASVAAYQAISGYVSYFGVDNIKANPFPTPIIGFPVASPYYKSAGDGSFIITASSNSNGVFTYSSDNESVATINSATGEVTIHAPGTAVITGNQAADGLFDAGLASYTLKVRPLINISDNQTASALGSSQPDVYVSSTGSLTIDASSTVHNITIDPNGKVTLNDGISLTVNQININTSSNGIGTFVDKNANGASINGNVQQTLTYGRNWYVSSPINYAYTANLWNLGSSVVAWDESTSTWPTISDYWGYLTVGKGYVSVANSNTGNTNISFSGTLNNNQVVVPLTRKGSTYSGFNLVGNPYPSYLDWSLVSAVNPDITSTIWYRTKTTGNAYTFSTINALGNIAVANGANTTITKFIPPMQAFWVRVNSGKTDANLTMTNAMRSHADALGNTFKAPQKDVQQLLRLQVSNGVTFDETVIYSDVNAQNGFDNYDSQKMSTTTADIPEIFTIVSGEQLVINGFANLQPDMEIPLGFRTGVSNSFSIKASEISNIGGRIILKDKLIGTEQELTADNVYTFTSDAITTTDRFSVIFRAAGAVTNLQSTNENKVLVYKNADNKIVIQSKLVGSDETVSVYNAFGQQLAKQQLTADKTTLDLALIKGVYLVTVNCGNKVISNKIIIN